ncbi:Calcium-transporting ATPase 1 [compost metagenome]
MKRGSLNLGKPKSAPAAPSRVVVRPWHVLPAPEVMQALSTPPDGLSVEEARKRLEVFGPNQLQLQEGPSAWQRFRSQFKSPLVAILGVAALVAIFVGDPFDVWVIVAVLFLNATIGFIQESKAADAIQALRRLTSPRARVWRAGIVHELLATEVVPGDVLLLESGDRLAADIRLLSATELTVDESGLTGESVPDTKNPAPLAEGDLPLGDRVNMAYMNTVVTGGRGRGVVVATGMATEMGQIASDVASAEGASPLQRRMRQFGRQIGILVLVTVVVVWLLGVFSGRDMAEMLYVAVTLAVAAVPEGLPIVVSIMLAIGVSRMARRRALIRRLTAAESLGSVTVICSDKTGTLTRNEMTVKEVFMGERLEVSGEGYHPRGAVLRTGAPLALSSCEGLLWLGRCAHLCNDAVLEERDSEWRILGDPTEGALVVLAEKLGIEPDWPRNREIPFNSDRQWMATLNETPEGEGVVFVKGAFDRLLPQAKRWMDPDGREHPLDEAAASRFQEAAEAMAQEALRVLALGMVRRQEPHAELYPPALAQELVLLGLVGMIDPPRREAAEAVATCGEAGIAVKMITGDHEATGKAIAAALGILKAPERAISGVELDRLSDAELQDRVSDLDVFARVSPTHKLRIVTALQRQGELVAMTGDGVNDAPALAQSDIGIAMGITGTEVAKGASGMILADDNFATIVSAVEQGRAISSNLRKAIAYLMTAAVGNIAVIVGALLLGLPLPFTPVQILWINLIATGVLDKTFAFEPTDPEQMHQPPLPPSTPLVPRASLGPMIAYGLLMAVGTLAVFLIEFSPDKSLMHARTEAFTTMVAFQWFSAFAFRSRYQPTFWLPLNRWMLGGLVLGVVLQTLVVYWPPLQRIMGTTAISLGEYLMTLAVGSSLLWLSELWKLLRR